LASINELLVPAFTTLVNLNMSNIEVLG